MDLSWVSDFATPNLPASKGFLVRYWRKNSRSGVFRDESGSGDVVDASSVEDDLITPEIWVGS